jgi:hypothetical protein
MADTTAVNSQITDAVTQSNVKVLADSPAYAMSSLYQTLAHSTGILFENAVAAQQLQNVTTQAATNQGVIQIYSVDTAAGGLGTHEILSSSPEALQARTLQATAATKSAFAASSEGVNAQIEAAIKLANDSTLGHAGDVAHAIRSSAEAVAAALQAVSKALHDDLMRTLQMAATAACLEGMLRDPSKAAEYEAVLRVVKALD